MEQKNKELQLKDLCARLPYGVNITWDEIYPITCTPSIYNAIWLKRDKRFKLYLRPMSSMTEEERGEFRTLGGIMSYSPQHDHWTIAALAPEAYDWLNKKMFAYRTLDGKDMFELGLALPAPDGMYEFKK